MEPADTGNMSKTVYSLPFLTEITDLPLDFLTRLRKLWFIDRADLEFEPNEGPKNMGNSSSFLINRDLRKQMQYVIYSSSKNRPIKEKRIFVEYSKVISGLEQSLANQDNEAGLTKK